MGETALLVVTICIVLGGWSLQFYSMWLDSKTTNKIQFTVTESKPTHPQLDTSGVKTTMIEMGYTATEANKMIKETMSKHRYLTEDELLSAVMAWEIAGELNETDNSGHDYWTG